MADEELTRYLSRFPGMSNDELARSAPTIGAAAWEQYYRARPGERPRSGPFASFGPYPNEMAKPAQPETPPRYRDPNANNALLPQLTDATGKPVEFPRVESAGATEPRLVTIIRGNEISRQVIPAQQKEPGTPTPAQLPAGIPSDLLYRQLIDRRLGSIGRYAPGDNFYFPSASRQWIDPFYNRDLPEGLRHSGFRPPVVTQPQRFMTDKERAAQGVTYPGLTPQQQRYIDEDTKTAKVDLVRTPASAAAAPAAAAPAAAALPKYEDLSTLRSLDLGLFPTLNIARAKGQRPLSEEEIKNLGPIGRGGRQAGQMLKETGAQLFDIGTLPLRAIADVFGAGNFGDKNLRETYKAVQEAQRPRVQPTPISVGETRPLIGAPAWPTPLAQQTQASFGPSRAETLGKQLGKLVPALEPDQRTAAGSQLQTRGMWTAPARGFNEPETTYALGRDGKIYQFESGVTYSGAMSPEQRAGLQEKYVLSTLREAQRDLAKAQTTAAATKPQMSQEQMMAAVIAPMLLSYYTKLREGKVTAQDTAAHDKLFGQFISVVKGKEPSPLSQLLRERGVTLNPALGSAD